MVKLQNSGPHLSNIIKQQKILKALDLFAGTNSVLPGNSVIDLFSLYVLFSHFRPGDATQGNSIFQMSSYARANLRITNEKSKRKIPMRASRGLKWENKMYKLKRSIASFLIMIPKKILIMIKTNLKGPLLLLDSLDLPIDISMLV